MSPEDGRPAEHAFEKLFRKHAGFLKGWQAEYFQQQKKRLLQTAPYIPHASGEHGAALEVGTVTELMLHYLHHECGYEVCYGTQFDFNNYVCGKKILIEDRIEGNDENFIAFDINIESGHLPIEDNFFDFILCTEVIEHLRRDPGHFLHEMNRVSKDNGSILITTPNVCCLSNIRKILEHKVPMLFPGFPGREDYIAQHVVEYSVPVLQALLRDSGFTPVETRTFTSFTQDDEEMSQLLKNLGASLEFREDNILCLARKTGQPRARYSSAIYV